MAYIPSWERIAHAQGMEQGMEQGMQQGMELKEEFIVHNLLSSCTADNLIIRYTGISSERLAELKNKLMSKTNCS